LIAIALTLYFTLGSTFILTMWSLETHEHKKSSHLFVSSLIYFSNIF
jgi:hypothetical protein